MLHTKFRGNRSTDSGEEYFCRVFTIYGAWSCDPHAANKISFPLPKEAPEKVWLLSAKRFLRIRYQSIVDDDGRTTDGRTTDAGTLVYYKLTYEPLAQVS